MALRPGKLYDMLRSGGVPDDKACKAAQGVAAYEEGPNEIESNVGVLKRITGAPLAGVLTPVIRAFTP